MIQQIASLATNKLNSGKPQLCLNREVGLAEAEKIIRFIRGKSIVVFHCSAGFVARLLQSAVQSLVTLQSLVMATTKQ